MLQLKNISFAYDKKPVLRNINLQVRAGEHISIIGESGCGKSTLLQLIYGLHHPEGKIFWNQKQLLGPNFNLVPGEPFMKYLAQDFDLMLPLTAAENVGKHLSNMYPRKKQQRIKQLLEVVEMTGQANVKAGKLSGGQQQRIALARALAKEPDILLMDEPFSHIDHFKKNNLRRQVYSYLKEQNITCITATHDSTDALSFATRTVVLKNGKIHADESPEDLYNKPPSKYVGSLFGDVNELQFQNIIPGENKEGTILLYPHEIKIASNGSLKAKVLNSFFKGKNYEIVAELNGERIFFDHSSCLASGKEVYLSISQKIIEARTRIENTRNL